MPGRRGHSLGQEIRERIWAKEDGSARKLARTELKYSLARWVGCLQELTYGRGDHSGTLAVLWHEMALAAINLPGFRRETGS